MDWKENYLKNKWTICLENSFYIGEQKVTRTHVVAIPPTSGDRIDVIGTSGQYYYGMTKKVWNKKEESENGEWTDRKIQDNVELVIIIKSGEIEIKGKL